MITVAPVAQSPSQSDLANSTFDVVIVGAGMVGSALAGALAGSALRVALIESRDLSLGVGPDGRASALGLGSIQLFEAIGAWEPMQRLGVSPIERIEISDGAATGLTHLHCQEIKQSALGYIVENRVTQAGLHHVIRASDNIHLIYPARILDFSLDPDWQHITLSTGSPEQPESVPIKAKLLVACDGARSQVRHRAGIPVRAWAYGQSCIVTTVTTEQPHRQVAYERFHQWGPFAILPMTPATSTPARDPSHRSCVVWTVPDRERERLMGLSDLAFLAAMAPSFGSQMGEILSASARASYHPQRLHATRYVDPRLALVGDAAHATHPVGGQGVNMGLRDVMALAQLLLDAAADGQDPGDPQRLKAYQGSRCWDNRAVLLGTDLANRMFSNDWMPLQGLRRLGLRLIDRSPVLKRPLMQQAMGIAPYHPRLERIPQTSPSVI
jgi:2-octaprenyl-6-methoxyphenol hydroxylase